jgi:hypothetical protein
VSPAAATGSAVASTSTTNQPLERQHEYWRHSSLEHRLGVGGDDLRLPKKEATDAVTITEMFLACNRLGTQIAVLRCW